MEEPLQKINHFLVPEHTRLTEEEKKEFLEKQCLGTKQLPRIFHSDAAIKSLNANIGDIIKIIRDSPTAKKIEFYRVVING